MHVHWIFDNEWITGDVQFDGIYRLSKETGVMQTPHALESSYQELLLKLSDGRIRCGGFGTRSRRQVRNFEFGRCCLGSIVGLWPFSGRFFTGVFVPFSRNLGR